jgi:deoxyribodipyrimidine photolyase-related protein
MKFYQDYLERKKLKVIYIEAKNELSDTRKLIPHLKQKGIEEIHFADVADNWLEKRIKQTAEKTGIIIHEYPSPCFLNSREELKEYFSGKKKYSQTDFYIKQRKKLGILIDENGSPVGGKWTYDAENRLKYHAAKKPPKVNYTSENKYYKEAVTYVNKHFPNNYGEIDKHVIYPNTFDESKKWFKEFLVKRFLEFGDYEDAIVAGENILNHSVLTPMLNIGLVTPKYIVEETLNFSVKHKIPLNSVEGFIRQIIGWREFIRGVYDASGSIQRTKNYWGFKRKIPENFWNGTTGLNHLISQLKKFYKQVIVIT